MGGCVGPALALLLFFLSCAFAGTLPRVTPPTGDHTGLVKSKDAFISLALQDPKGTPNGLTVEQGAYGELCLQWTTTHDPPVANTGGSVVFDNTGANYFPNEKDLLGKWYTITNAAVGTGVSGVVSLGTDKTTQQQVALKEQFFNEGATIAQIVRETGIHIVLDEYGKAIKPKPKKITTSIYRAWVGPRTVVQGYPPNRPNTGAGQRSDISLWIAMERASENLENRWGQKPQALNLTRCPNIKDFTNILYQLSEAYELMHAAGIQHRDMKPDNIMFVGTQPLPIDFGLSRPLDNANNTATDVGSFGKMILEVMRVCFASLGASSDPVTEAMPRGGGSFGSAVFVPSSFTTYIAAIPANPPKTYPVWKEVFDLGVRAFSECTASQAVCPRGRMTTIKDKLQALRVAALVV